MWRSSRAIVAATFLAPAVVAAAAAGSSVTLHSDGAVVERELSARSSFVECKLPAGVKEGSLRVTPAAGVAIDRVEVVSDEPKNTPKKLESLRERRRQLEDRLKALETKEEIFTAAAKSQSGKAPRKTKTNPDPMVTIRQGTQYAVSQLEEVYRARRLAEDELKKLDAALSAGAHGGKGATARIWIKEKSGRVRVAYFLPDTRWKPIYDLRVPSREGNAVLTLRAGLPPVEQETSVAVSVGNETIPVSTRQSQPEVKRFTLPVTVVPNGSGPRGTFSVSVANNAAVSLPAGDVSCYVDGIFVGKADFPATVPGEKAVITNLR